MNTKTIFIALAVLCSSTLFSQTYQINGNLGIGTTPESKLDVEGDAHLRGDTEVDGELLLKGLEFPISYAYERLVYLEDEGRVQRMTPELWEDVVQAMYKRACTGDADPTWLNSNGHMFLCNLDDRVGIGTTDPSEQLDVAGNVLFQSKLHVGVSSMSLEDQFYVNGSSRFNGAVIGNSSASFAGNLSSGSLSVTGSSTLSGLTTILNGLTLSGTSNFNGTLNFNGVSSFAHTVTIEDGLTINSQSDPAWNYGLRINGGDDDQKALAVRHTDGDGVVVFGDGRLEITPETSASHALLVESDSEERFKLGLDGSITSSISSSAADAISVTRSIDDSQVFLVRSDGFTYAQQLFTEKVTVELAPFPDYVFEMDYQLMSLYDLQQYIKDNQRLPNMPSAKSVEEVGADLGEMNRLLVEKVEELTLYILQLNERIEVLEGNSGTESK